MKKLILLLAILSFSLNALAQRMNFLGQPLGCSLNTFKQRMINKGYKYQGEVEKNIYYFDGSFGGDNVLVGACVTPKTKTVYEIIVYFNQFESYSFNDASIDRQEWKFNKLVDAYMSKYGNPSIHNFDKKLYSWNYEYGYISIYIGEEDLSGKRALCVFYNDFKAAELNEKECESDY